MTSVFLQSFNLCCDVTRRCIWIINGKKNVLTYFCALLLLQQIPATLKLVNITSKFQLDCNKNLFSVKSRQIYVKVTSVHQNIIPGTVHRLKCRLWRSFGSLKFKNCVSCDIVPVFALKIRHTFIGYFLMGMTLVIR